MSGGSVSGGSASGRLPDEAGAGTVVVLALVGLVLSTALVVAACVGLVRAQRQAQSAADLAALAAAVVAARGQDACVEASRLAEANGARLTSCERVGATVRVRAAVPGPAWGGFAPELVGEAQAGPR